MNAKRLMKFFHEIGTVGVMGAVATQIVLSHVGASSSPEDHAVIRQAIAVMCRWLLLPSLLLVLSSGMLAMAINRAFHSADWAWIKALMTPLVFEAVLVAVDSPARAAAELSSRVASGDASAEAALAEALWHEQGGLWITMLLFAAQIALAIWRPKRRSRLDTAARVSQPAPSFREQVRPVRPATGAARDPSLVPPES